MSNSDPMNLDGPTVDHAEGELAFADGKFFRLDAKRTAEANATMGDLEACGDLLARALGELEAKHKPTHVKAALFAMREGLIATLGGDELFEVKAYTTALCARFDIPNPFPETMVAAREHLEASGAPSVDISEA